MSSLSPGEGAVLLATFDVPFDPAAALFALDAAADSGRRLIIANVAEVVPLGFERVSRFPLNVMLDHDVLTYSPGLAAAVGSLVDRARALGIRTEHVHLNCFGRVTALVGPDRRKVGKRFCRKAAAQIQERLGCLVWVSCEISGPPDQRP